MYYHFTTSFIITSFFFHVQTLFNWISQHYTYTSSIFRLLNHKWSMSHYIHSSHILIYNISQFNYNIKSLCWVTHSNLYFKQVNILFTLLLIVFDFILVQKNHCKYTNLTKRRIYFIHTSHTWMCICSHKHQLIITITYKLIL